LPSIDDRQVLDTLLLFHDWHAGLPTPTDMTSLDYSLEHGHISEEEFREGELANKEYVKKISQKFQEWDNYFKLDLPFYFDFLAKLKKFGESIDESVDSSLSNPGFTKALIQDLLTAISDPEQREKSKIWIFLRIGGFLKEIPELAKC
jgi:hypothetical protein